jgi:hypothetical protein
MVRFIGFKLLTNKGKFSSVDDGSPPPYGAMQSVKVEIVDDPSIYTPLDNLFA